MARNDGMNRTSARNANLTAAQIGNAQRHNEREKESYNNPDIVPERTGMNVHFKTPTGSYAEMFAQMEKDGFISTRGLKDDAHLYGELIFDVNSAYFYNHGGYEFAKRFYADAYKAAVKIVGGEQYILSAVMHADERNRAMSEALGEDVYHYHLHVVYVPVVEKQILWTKRCKDKSLVGKVKETVMQVSSSKKWRSAPATDEAGRILLQRNGKPILRKSYSVLQDDFYEAMRAAGYDDIQRGERGSDEQHLTVTEFKVERERARLQELEQATQKKEAALKKVEQKTKVQKTVALTFQEIDSMGRRTNTYKWELTPQEIGQLQALAKKGVKAKAEIPELRQKLERAQKDSAAWRERYQRIEAQTRDYREAARKAPEAVKEAVDRALEAPSIPRMTQERQRTERQYAVGR